MVLLICILFGVISITSLLLNKKNVIIYAKNIKLNFEIVYISFGIFLVIISGFRGEGIDRDYLNYKDLHFIGNESLRLTIEPSFNLISQVVKNLFNNNVTILFVTYALFGVSTKLLAIKKTSEFWLLSLLIYISYLFTLQEMTQIRVGVASGFIMLCIAPLKERHAIRFLLFASLAIFFHYSAIIVLFLWFLNPDKINIKFYALIIIGSYLIHEFSAIYITDIQKYIPITPLENKLLAYKYDNESNLNIFNVWQLMRTILCFLFLWKINIIQKENKYSILLLKLYIISTCSFVLLSTNPSFAARISDLFAVSDIILLPCILYFIKPALFAKLLIICISFFYLFLNLFFNKIIT